MEVAMKLFIKHFENVLTARSCIETDQNSRHGKYLTMLIKI